MNYENWKLHRQLEDPTRDAYQKMKISTDSSLFTFVLTILVIAVVGSAFFFIFYGKALISLGGRLRGSFESSKTQNVN